MDGEIGYNFGRDRRNDIRKRIWGSIKVGLEQDGDS
jgi:hypothetical protein